MSLPTERTGVIHDIGYRRYEGPRMSRAQIIGSLLWSGILAVFGFGRSGKAKVLPFLLLGFTLVPSMIQIGIIVFIGLDADLLNYSEYNAGTSFIVVLFVAAQAPVLFSRDLRSGVISLYLARPLGATAFALTRWASLVLAILAFVLTPLLLIFIGGLSAGADLGNELPRVAVAAAGAVLLALLLATAAAVIASWTLRRGLAVAGTIIVLLVGLGVTTGVQEVALLQGEDKLAQWLVLLSPFVVVDSIQAGFSDATAQFTAPAETTGMAALLLLTAVAMMAIGLLLLIRRYRSKGA